MSDVEDAEVIRSKGNKRVFESSDESEGKIDHIAAIMRIY
jgi:hypothetical protein